VGKENFQLCLGDPSRGLIRGPVCRSSLPNAGLAGELPLNEDVWKPLRTLKELDLAGNSLHGYVPPEIGNLQSLQTLSLQNNKFAGDLPSEWAQLSNLENLNVSNNNFQGSIPVEWIGSSTSPGMANLQLA
jgi:hypothetical protein